ncbi:glycerophosphodiester phosphodiesterase family protein [Maricaulis sp.]|uniref:glycerophosphodiester phosphodiesterase family protein n=1 Tax=Maricaulis sp. TaxID=1486257 RepID=UPI002B269AB7|nr:glycerophosphodiester phosphodiesterase family protein [Maricaulis sp.]
MRQTPIAALALLTACTQAANAPSMERAAPAIAMDCFRDADISMLAAHRGGPAPGYPENALTSLDRLIELGVLYAEIDVRRTADGVLFLLHDDTLDRTTSGSGPLDGLTWEELSGLRLHDNNGRPTNATLPTLADAIALARRTGLVLNLDLKSIPAGDIVAFVHDQDARDQLAIITYTVADAAAVHDLDPGLLLSVPNDLPALRRAGLNLDASYVWMGTGSLDPVADTRLADLGLETSAGLFRRENGRPELYLEARDANIELIAVDDVETAVRALGGAETLHNQIAACRG